MMTFDASGRETCSVRESRTNTPLQALTLMNDVTFVEAARVLAERVMTQGGSTPEDRLTLAFRLATARRPDAGRAGGACAMGSTSTWRTIARIPKRRTKLARAGEAPRRRALDPGELAAYTTVAGLILNLDETITKE